MAKGIETKMETAGNTRDHRVLYHHITQRGVYRTMKKITATLMLLTLFIAVPHAALAETTAAIDVNSAYVWRGITFNDGLVVQPSVDVSHKGFGFNVWGNYDISDYNETVDDYEFSEVDLTLSYGFTLWKIDLSVGLIEYLFPANSGGSGGAGTREAFATAGMEVISGLSVGVEYYYDFDEVRDYYAAASVAYAYDFTSKLGAEAGVHVGYAGKDFSAGEDGGFHDWGAYISASFAVTDALSVGASVNYTDSMDTKVLPEPAEGETGNSDVEVYGGVSISYAF